VFTRFLPVTKKIQDIIFSGELGRIKRLHADFSIDFKPDGKSRPSTQLTVEKDYSWRMIDPALGGGSLLDMGPYPAAWAMLLLHHNPLNTSGNLPKLVFSHQTKYERSGVDANSRWLLEWEGVGQAMCMTDMTAHGAHVGCVVVTCERGDLSVEGESYWLCEVGKLLLM
jgi:predicted dehydrogenase